MATKPIPRADEVSAFHWEAAAAGRLDVQRCRACRQRMFPPEVACTSCRSEDVGPETVSGRGRVYSFTVVRQMFDPAWQEDVPYVVGLVELDDDPSVRVLTNVVDVDPESVVVGMPVELAFEERQGIRLPQFRPC